MECGGFMVEASVVVVEGRWLRDGVYGGEIGVGGC